MLAVACTLPQGANAWGWDSLVSSVTSAVQKVVDVVTTASSNAYDSVVTKGCEQGVQAAMANIHLPSEVSPDATICGTLADLAKPECENTVTKTLVPEAKKLVAQFSTTCAVEVKNEIANVDVSALAADPQGYVNGRVDAFKERHTNQLQQLVSGEPGNGQPGTGLGDFQAKLSQLLSMLNSEQTSEEQSADAAATQAAATARLYQVNGKPKTAFNFPAMLCVGAAATSVFAVIAFAIVRRARRSTDEARGAMIEVLEDLEIE